MAFQCSQTPSMKQRVNLIFFSKKLSFCYTSGVKISESFFNFFSSWGVEGEEAISAKKQKKKKKKKKKKNNKKKKKQICSTSGVKCSKTSFYFFLHQESKARKQFHQKNKTNKNKESADDSESTKVSILDDFWILDERLNLNTNSYVLICTCLR